MSDLIDREDLYDTFESQNWHHPLDQDIAHECVMALPPAQPETAKRIVGKSRGGMTLWYKCDMCNEPVDVQDNYCRGCGRRLTDG